MKRLHPLLLLILLSIPFVLWGKIQILPTFDDWNTLSSPNYDREWVKFFLPYGSVWRPIDALLGYITGADYHLFPILNHLLIFAGHLGSTGMLWLLCRHFRLTANASAVAAAFFYFSPCMLGTVLSCDGVNQTYSHLWGMVATWCYLCRKSGLRYVYWALFVWLAALSKDNGIAWAVVPPILAFAFYETDRHTLLRHLAFGLSIALVYGAVRLSLPKTEIYNPDYTTFVLSRKVRELCMLAAYTWVAADYICLLHAPSRHLWVFGITLLCSLPLLWVLFGRCRVWHDRTLWCLIVAALIVLSPHLLITLSVMNAYAGLGIAALIVGYAASHVTHRRLLQTTVALWLCTALFTDIHHGYMSWKTSLAGREMALETLRQMPRPVERAYCLIIEDDYPKFSSFCVVPSDAYGWGNAVSHETGHVWPRHLRDTVIARRDSAQAPVIARRALRAGYDCVWLVDRSHVRVIPSSQSLHP